jgi:branched-chain amino acid aminotransferase
MGRDRIESKSIDRNCKRENRGKCSEILNVLFNGELVSDLVLSASGDPGRNGWLLGDGIFETLKSIDGKIWAFSHHLDRAYKSGAILEFALPIRSDVEVGMQKLLEATKEIEHGRIRITFLSNGDWVATHKVLELSSNELSVVDYRYPKNENSIELSGEL